jgi:hypothetical protein
MPSSGLSVGPRTRAFRWSVTQWRAATTHYYPLALQSLPANLQMMTSKLEGICPLVWGNYKNVGRVLETESGNIRRPRKATITWVWSSCPFGWPLEQNTWPPMRNFTGWNTQYSCLAWSPFGQLPFRDGLGPVSCLRRAIPQGRYPRCGCRCTTKAQRCPVHHGACRMQ